MPHRQQRWTQCRRRGRSGRRSAAPRAPPLARRRRPCRCRRIVRCECERRPRDGGAAACGAGPAGARRRRRRGQGRDRTDPTASATSVAVSPDECHESRPHGLGCSRLRERPISRSCRPRGSGDSAGSRSRVESLGPEARKTRLVHVRVDLCRRQVGVPEHHLDRAQVSAAVEQVGRKRVPEDVRLSRRVDARLDRVLLQNLPERPCASAIRRRAR